MEKKIIYGSVQVEMVLNAIKKSGQTVKYKAECKLHSPHNLLILMFSISFAQVHCK